MCRDNWQRNGGRVCLALFLGFFCVFLAVSAYADSATLYGAGRGASDHITQQREAALCADYAQNLIQQLKSNRQASDMAGQEDGFRRDVIAALDALVACRQQDAQAMEQRNNAEIRTFARDIDL